MFPTSPLRKHASPNGKSKFNPQDEFTDLNPPITYRHILSPPPGARNPLRVIALCDSDAFYAACEQVRLGIDPSRPLVVRQWDALIAVNYPARAFGIARMRNWREALKMCPELTVVHVATYKEGDKAPRYWDNPDTATHKVRLYFLVVSISESMAGHNDDPYGLRNQSITTGALINDSCYGFSLIEVGCPCAGVRIGLPRLLPTREREDHRYIQGGLARR